MFKRFLNGLLVISCAFSLIACVEEDEASVKTWNPDNRPNNQGGFPTKPVAIPALEESSQFLIALEELSRIQRGAALALDENDRNDHRRGCIWYDFQRGTKPFLKAIYECMREDERKGGQQFVRIEDGKESYDLTRDDARIFGTWKTFVRRPNEKANITGGKLTRDLKMRYPDLTSPTMKATYKAVYRGSSEDLHRNQVGEVWIAEFANQEILTPNSPQIELRKGFKLKLSYQADPFATKSSPQIITLTAKGPVYFSERCPRPSGVFDYQITYKNHVVKEGSLIANESGFQIDAETPVAWPSVCLDP
jgi:hypothetical protein